MKAHCLPSYVYKHWNQYYVQQWEGGKLKTFGKFKTEHEAIQCRNKLLKQGIIKPKLGLHKIKYYPNRYIIRTPANTYAIIKRHNGKNEHFGTYRSLENARKERDYLESIGWDYDNME